MRPDVSWLPRWGVYTPTGRYHQLPPCLPLSPYVHAVCQKAWGGSKWDETEIVLVDTMCSGEGNSEVRKREDEGLRDGRSERGKKDEGWKRDVKYSRIKKDEEEEEEGRCDRVPTDRLLLSERSQCAHYSPLWHVIQSFNWREPFSLVMNVWHEKAFVFCVTNKHDVSLNIQVSNGG